MIPVAEAQARVLSLATPLDPEPIPLHRAAGRVLARDAVAQRSQPPFAASAMDGYAVQDPVHQGQILDIVGESQAGTGWSGTVHPGQAVRIFTGAPLPDGATRVVIQEDVTRDGNRITLNDGWTGNTNIRPLGADFLQGHRLAAPRRLRPADLALLAAMNEPFPQVHRRPVVAFIPTGDELVLPGDTPGPDQIVASNHFALAAMAEAEGAEVRIMPIARDNSDALRDILALAASADVVVTIGGASVGEHDLVARIAGEAGLERAFHKIAMRPGKPLMSGRLGQAIMLGLPGNPVSAIVCGHLFLVPLLRALQGLPDPLPVPLKARLAVDLPKNGPRAHYMRARVSQGDGLPAITPWDDQDSSRLVPLADAEGLLIRPPGAGPALAGDAVEWIAI